MKQILSTQNPDEQVSEAAQVPQLTGVSQLFVTYPHSVSAQVVLDDSAVHVATQVVPLETYPELHKVKDLMVDPVYSTAVSVPLQCADPNQKSSLPFVISVEAVTVFGAEYPPSGMVGQLQKRVPIVTPDTVVDPKLLINPDPATQLQSFVPVAVRAVPQLLV
jgi:hypothetical protein